MRSACTYRVCIYIGGLIKLELEVALDVDADVDGAAGSSSISHWIEQALGFSSLNVVGA